MKSRIWEERWWKASTALWEQGWKWMGGRPQRCYRLISTMGCPTDPRCPNPGSHDIQGPTKSRSPTRETWRSYRFNWGLPLWWLEYKVSISWLSQFSFDFNNFQAIIGIKAIIATRTTKTTEPTIPTMTTTLLEYPWIWSGSRSALVGDGILPPTALAPACNYTQ